MPTTSGTCGSVWRTKFLGEPPPRISTPDLPPERLAPSTIAAVSFTSRDMSILSLQPSMASGHVHADRAVARRGGVDRHAVLVRGGVERAAGERERELARAHRA